MTSKTHVYNTLIMQYNKDLNRRLAKHKHKSRLYSSSMYTHTMTKLNFNSGHFYIMQSTIPKYLNLVLKYYSTQMKLFNTILASNNKKND